MLARRRLPLCLAVRESNTQALRRQIFASFVALCLVKLYFTATNHNKIHQKSIRRRVRSSFGQKIASGGAEKARSNIRYCKRFIESIRRYFFSKTLWVRFPYGYPKRRKLYLPLSYHIPLSSVNLPARFFCVISFFLHHRPKTRRNRPFKLLIFCEF